MQTAYLVKIDYKLVTTKVFVSYERAQAYYHEMVRSIENVLKSARQHYEVREAHDKTFAVTEFKQYDVEHKYCKTLGLVSINRTLLEV